MQNASFLHCPFTTNLLTISYAAALATGSYLICGESLEREASPLGAGLRLAAIALVVLWSHLLIWIFRRISRRQTSAAYCALLFFGGWAIFFLIYNCLI